MRIEQLQAFLAIAETGNFGQAANQCGITQSTISRQIQALEAALGTLLFHRSTQAKLTVAGDKLLPRARKICQEWATVTQEIIDLQAGRQPDLCVAAIHSVCSHFLPPILQQFCQNYPNVQLRVTALGSDRALKVLRDGLVDIAIVMNNRFLTTSPEMSVSLLYEENIEVLMAANHPLTAYKTIPHIELSKYPQVMFKDGYGMQRLLQEWFAHQNLTINAVMELNTLDAFRGVVRQGEIIALLPETALIETRQDNSLAVRSLSPILDISTEKPTVNLTRQVVLVTTSDRLTIPPIAHFCDLVRQGVNLLNEETIHKSLSA
ncbi:LysR family transcriptional regulator [Crocosphaera sp. UHCC 0190]|uniref:LysR family transcriptional regulator n=1 Tax=Crocosphaera sp. UHCC 0190 TaxID=3110246 RepID=UPI002B21A4DE|nr:LysR family transcriptional regulator [Crocosphaera sp. UHCC 0190]MEA5509809.1 LysR family transcriptional regulator [Crocosphaera sp. UHCC 0190]